MSVTTDYDVAASPLFVPASELPGIPSVSDLDGFADRGLLPPWIAHTDPPYGWRYHPDLDADGIAWFLEQNIVWVPRIEKDEAIATVEWLATLDDQHRAKRVLFDWLRYCDPVTATSDAFAWWCNYHPTRSGSSPSAEETAARFATVSAWYAMLEIESATHNHPQRGLSVKVVDDA